MDVKTYSDIIPENMLFCNHFQTFYAVFVSVRETLDVILKEVQYCEVHNVILQLNSDIIYIILM